MANEERDRKAEGIRAAIFDGERLTDSERTFMEPIWAAEKAQMLAEWEKLPRIAWQPPERPERCSSCLNRMCICRGHQHPDYPEYRS